MRVARANRLQVAIRGALMSGIVTLPIGRFVGRGIEMKLIDDLKVGQTVYFAELPIGASFNCNGNHVVKQSTRTGRISAYAKTAYYAANERVEIVYLPVRE
jgi:hypothetical protein